MKITLFGARFVRWYSETFLKHRHFDKLHQLGYNVFGPMSKITFADCAHAMINMLKDDTWIGKAPVVQY